MSLDSIIMIVVAVLGFGSAFTVLIKDLLATKRGFEGVSKENTGLEKDHDRLTKEHDKLEQSIELGNSKLANSSNAIHQAIVSVDKELSLVSDKVRSELIHRHDLAQASTMGMREIQHSIDSLTALNELLKETNHINSELRETISDLRHQLEVEKSKCKQLENELTTLRNKYQSYNNDYGPEF